ncbi:helix-turn-helix domain-containing protein [Granulicatella adiacens ATCC 49175]|uniref:helix-turn-helix domain-containing protein n=1 Tax=Granulicatella adiacens TaxID=46124 RepID=UPI000587811A|nr:XRE family transcriptional regulator [Granulicatella adiacens]UAK93767.1 helix-turn-helix domain-containing protein [Granulicatella adiacens]UWP39002.1 helix-turn-helix domain-containing protein [Granulicatella adiacens ATCC 49175]
MGQYQKKLYTQLNTTYPNFVSDFNKEYSKQKIALQLVELRLETGLSQRKYAKANELMQNKVSNLEKGRSNPRLSTIIEMAAKNGYKVELKYTK